MSHELKKEVLDELDPIMRKIIDITCDKAGIGSVMCDPWLASIDDHTFDEALDTEILEKIGEYYGLDLDIFAGHEALITIALYIWINLDEDN